jgi:hypothetical protein
LSSTQGGRRVRAQRPRDRWLYGRTWDPEHERLEDYTDARLSGLIRAAAGVGDLPVRVVAMGAFSFAAQVAERYREAGASWSATPPGA